MADLESRVQNVEIKAGDLDRRVSNAEGKISCIEKDCATERITMAELKILISNSIAQNDKTMQLLKWIVIAAAAIISALTGIKVAIPSI